jgi:hypothetical protein
MSIWTTPLASPVVSSGIRLLSSGAWKALPAPLSCAGSTTTSRSWIETFESSECCRRQAARAEGAAHFPAPRDFVG